jgi:hypothetical protein
MSGEKKSHAEKCTYAEADGHCRIKQSFGEWDTKTPDIENIRFYRTELQATFAECTCPTYANACAVPSFYRVGVSLTKYIGEHHLPDIQPPHH